jgi:hypothetical protein
MKKERSRRENLDGIGEMKTQLSAHGWRENEMAAGSCGVCSWRRHAS